MSLKKSLFNIIKKIIRKWPAMNTRLRHMDNHQNLDTLAKTVQTNTQTVDLSVPLLFLLSLSVFLSALEPWRQTEWQGQGVLVNEL